MNFFNDLGQLWGEILWERIFLIIIIPLVALTIIYILFKRSRNKFKDNIDALKTCVELLAFTLAAVYFFYQFGTGLSVTNLDLAVSTERQRAGKNESANHLEYLKVTVSLKKGNVNSLYLHEIKGRLRVDGADFNPLEFTGYNPIQFTQAGNTATFANWDADGKKYQLAPSEATQFSSWALVPDNKVCYVEVAVMGGAKKLHYALAQWRASDVSLPKENVAIVAKAK